MNLHDFSHRSSFYTRQEAGVVTEPLCTGHGNFSEVSEDSITIAAELLEINHDVTDENVIHQST